MIVFNDVITTVSSERFCGFLLGRAWSLEESSSRRFRHNSHWVFIVDGGCDA
jgi:hypothetical protein